MGVCGGGLMQPFHIMDVFDIRLYKAPASLDIIVAEFLCGHHPFKLRPEAMLHRRGDEVAHRIKLARLQGFVPGTNGRSKIGAGRLESGVWRALAGTMKAYQCFEEMPVCQFFRINSQFANRDGLLKRGPDFLIP